MSITQSSDPISIVARTIMFQLMMHPWLSALVRPGNRIDFAGGSDPEPGKDSITDGDLPELVLLPAGGVMNPRDGSSGVSSSSRALRQRYLVGIHTKQPVSSDNNGGANTVKWRFFQACLGLEDLNTPGGVMGNPNVVWVRPGDFFDELGRDVLSPQLQREVDGWTCGVTIEVLMVFTLAEALT